MGKAQPLNAEVSGAFRGHSIFSWAGNNHICVSVHPVNPSVLFVKPSAAGLHYSQ